MPRSEPLGKKRSRESRRVLFWLPLAILLLGLVGAGPLFAQSAESVQAERRRTQFLLLIDDSGSMSQPVQGLPATDPDRLAVFAVKSLLSMLEDSDEVSIVRLNATLGTDPLPAIRPLAVARAEYDPLLRLDGQLASYAGPRTDCKTGLERSARILNDAWQPGTSQVLVFLTDGACEEKTPLRSDEFLPTLKAHEERSLQFYFLRFTGRPFTPELEMLARQTGGATFALPPGDATGILAPFARAVARSQGYEPYILAPGQQRLTAHRASRKVRLLAVAPGEGPPLTIDVKPLGHGLPPRVLGPARADRHQYKGGRVFRYAALEYGPGDVPVEVGIAGASDWKAVALPHYALRVKTRVQKGSCSSNGPEVQALDIGGTACLTVSVENEAGRATPAEDLPGNHEFLVGVKSPGGDESQLPLNRSGNALAGTLERANMREGDWVFQPVVRMGMSGGVLPAELRAAPRTLQVSSQRMAVTPARLDFARMIPGETRLLDITLEGNFSASRGRLVPVRGDELPRCLGFTLNGVAAGGSEQLTPGQKYSVGARVAPFCGVTSATRTISGSLRLETERASVEIPFDLVLETQSQIPSSLSAKLTSGESADLLLPVTVNSKVDPTFSLSVAPPEGSWPGKDLFVSVLDERGKPLDQGTSGKVTPRTMPGRLRVEAEGCCRTGVFDRTVVLSAQGTGEEVRIPLRVEVQYAGALRCYGRRILAGILVLLILLLIAYLWRLVTRSYFIDPAVLRGKLFVLRAEELGMVAIDEAKSRIAHENVAVQFGWLDRLKNWFAAKPWRAGLPGSSAFCETAYISLSLKPRMTISREPGVQWDSTKERIPEGVPAGHLYATATGKGSVRLWARYEDKTETGTGGRIAGLTPANPPAESKKDWIDIKGDLLATDLDERGRGAIAGWRLR